MDDLHERGKGPFFDLSAVRLPGVFPDLPSCKAVIEQWSQGGDPGPFLSKVVEPFLSGQLAVLGAFYANTTKIAKGYSVTSHDETLAALLALKGEILSARQELSEWFERLKAQAGDKVHLVSAVSHEIQNAYIHLPGTGYKPEHLWSLSGSDCLYGRALAAELAILAGVEPSEFIEGLPLTNIINRSGLQIEAVGRLFSCAATSAIEQGREPIAGFLELLRSSEITHRARNEGISVEFRVHSDKETMPAGFFILAEWVVPELMSNAIDSIQEAGRERKELTVTIQENFGVWSFNVLDTGKEIDEALRSRIFEPHFSTRRRDGGVGRGLGLSSVRKVVERELKGRIELSFSTKEGSMFTIIVSEPYTPEAEFE